MDDLIYRSTVKVLVSDTWWNEIDSIPAVDAVEVDRERLLSILRSYFEIGDSYTFELTRVKAAFEIGTMTFDDFVEWDEDNVDDLCDYIIKHCGARMDGEDGDA